MVALAHALVLSSCLKSIDYAIVKSEMNRLVRFFTPNNQAFYTLFEKSGESLAQGVKLLEELYNAPEAERPQWVKAIGKQEHIGDKILADINQKLNQTFVTPLEREDIFALASSFDKALDYIEDTADYVVVYGTKEPHQPMLRQVELVVQPTK